MDKVLPDKWIRKAVFDAINDMVIDGIEIPCFDTRVTANVNKDDPQHYVLMTTQLNQVDKNNKCEWFWESSILLDIVTRYDMPGNIGSRLLADNITDGIRAAINNLSLGGGLTVVTQTQSFPSDITTETRQEIIFRKFIRLELLIK